MPSLRGFATSSLAVNNTPQPVFGTTLSAAAIPVPMPASMSITSGFSRGYSTAVVAVASSAGFLVNDLCVLSSAPGSPAPRLPCLVSIVSISANNITVQGLTTPYLPGDFFVLAKVAASVTVQGRSPSTGKYQIGRNAVYTASLGLVFEMEQGISGNPDPVVSLSNIYGGNPIPTSEIWIMGTAGDTYSGSMVLT